MHTNKSDTLSTFQYIHSYYIALINVHSKLECAVLFTYFLKEPLMVKVNPKQCHAQQMICFAFDFISNKYYKHTYKVYTEEHHPCPPNRGEDRPMPRKV